MKPHPAQGFAPIGIVTCNEIGLTGDEELIARALKRYDAGLRAVPWDDGPPPENVSAFVVRSPWNYHLHPDAFLNWIDAAAGIAPVFNEPRVIRGNAHKGYLFDLRDAGVPIAPTVLLKAGETASLEGVMHERGWHEVVVKPAVSASSYMTAIVGATPHPALKTQGLDTRFVDDGQAHLEEILRTRDALTQPFMPEIFTRGERSLIYIGGAYSHCVQKDAFTTSSGGGALTEPEPAERDIAERALGTLAHAPLYARIDLLRDTHGAEMLMEFELIDPELYIRRYPPAAETFAETLMSRLQ